MRTRANLGLLLTLFISLSFTIKAQKHVDFTDVAQKSLDAVVHVKNIQEYETDPRSERIFEYFFGYKPQEKYTPQVGTGSGVIISQDGYIVTNHHVIDGSDKIEVTLNNNKTYTASVIGRDKQTDLALLKIEAKGLKHLPFGNSDQTKVGEWVLAVGNPFNLTSTVTAGIISAKSRDLTNSGRIQSFIQTDAVINPGNSGGALVNAKGELVGINALISTHTGVFEGYSFAIPANIAKRVISDLKNYGRPQRAFIGIVPVDLDEVKGKKLELTEGVYVYRLSTNGAAIESGIEKGDIITQLDNTKVKKNADLLGYLASKHPGDKVKVRLNRDGKSLTYDVVLRTIEGEQSLPPKLKLGSSKKLEKLGIDVRNLTSKEQKKVGNGVIVTKIESDSRLNSVGLEKGYVIKRYNRKKIKSIADLAQIIKASKDPSIRIEYMDKKGNKYRAYLN